MSKVSVLMGGSNLGEPGLILLVENSEEDERLALRAFRKSDIPNTVVVAHSGQEALEYLHGSGAHDGRSTPDPVVIFVDLKLGAMSGIDLVRALRSDPRTRIMPIVMMSGSMDGSVIEQCYLAGANSYLVKPVDMDEFTAVFRDATRYWLRLNRMLENSTQRAGRYLA